MEFKDWLEKKFLAWRGDKIQNSSISEFARELDISQQQMSDWMIGRSKPGTRTIPKLAARYPDVYTALGLPLPAKKPTVLDNLPNGIESVLSEAIHQAGYQVSAYNLDRNSEKAQKIYIKIIKDGLANYEDEMDDSKKG